MENLDAVKLIEEEISSDKGKRELKKPVEYPSHMQLGSIIAQNQKDLIKAIGSKNRAKEIADIITGSYAENPQLCKLITSSLDLDRLDYLARDSQATGVPFGRIDINYLLNNIRLRYEELGILEKAIPAAEQFLLARYFMYRCVYYHKTTYGMEEACRQLLRRIRDKKINNRGQYDIAVDGNEVKEIAKSPEKLAQFTDAYIDKVVQKAVYDKDKAIKELAKSIQSRIPPKLLKEVCVFSESNKKDAKEVVFSNKCKYELQGLAEKFGIDLRQFMFCSLKPIFLEKDPRRYTASEFRNLDNQIGESDEEKEKLRIFEDKEEKSKSLMEIDYSIISKCKGLSFRIYRLYVIYNDKNRKEVVEKLKEEVKDWEK